MAATARTIPKTNAGLVGFGAICSPHGKQSCPLGRIVRAKSSEMFELLHTYITHYFDGNNKGHLYQCAQTPTAIRCRTQSRILVPSEEASIGRSARKFFAPCVGCLTKGDPMPCQDRAAPGGSRVT